MKGSESLAREAREGVANLLRDAPWDSGSSLDRLRFHGRLPTFDTAHKLTLSAACAVGSYALGVEQWWHMMQGQHQSITIDWMQAASSLNPGHFQQQNGYALPALSLLTELKADFYQTLDQKWFFPIGSYPHLRDGVLDLLQCANTADALGASIARWKAEELEDAFADRKLPGCYARSAQEWLAHPQGQLLADKPVIEVLKISESEAERPALGDRPLAGVRVLDLGHVIAGPVVARSLAEHGADVLRVTHPTMQDPFRQTVDTNIGKRSAFIDLNRAVDLAKTLELVSGADIVVQSWRPGSMEARGLGPDELAAIRPGIIYVSVSAFGDEGPWGLRGGFEQLGQTVSGVAVSEGGDGKPRLVPTYLLNDYLTGYLGAAGVMMALIRRATEGGSYHVKVSLSRTSMWVQSLGLEPSYEPKSSVQHFAESLDPVLETRSSAYGLLQQLPPVAQFSRTPAYWDLPPAPNGAHDAEWLK